MVNKTLDFLKSKGIASPEIGIVLGTGLGKMAKELNLIQTLDYRQIPNFPEATVESHHGKLLYGEMNGKILLAMHGRFHYYEGYTLQQVTFPIRIMKLLGTKCLLLSNAAGALNLSYKKGTLMLIEDHISFLPDNPLRGRNDEKMGTRFPDMSRPYSQFLNGKLEAIAQREKIVLYKGVYAAVAGPNLETRAEYRFLGKFADAVGMSTVPEVIVANHMELPCAAVSVLTDECDPENLVPAKIEDIIRIAEEAEEGLIRLFSQLILEL